MRGVNRLGLPGSDPLQSPIAFCIDKEMADEYNEAQTVAPCFGAVHGGDEEKIDAGQTWNLGFHTF